MTQHSLAWWVQQISLNSNEPDLSIVFYIILYTGEWLFLFPHDSNAKHVLFYDWTQVQRHNICSIMPYHMGLNQACELDRFWTEFKFEFEFKIYLQVRVQVWVLRILFFEFKFEFGKNDRVRVQVRVRSPGLCRSQWHEQINNMQLFFW